MTPPAGPELALDTASTDAVLGVVDGATLLAERRWTVDTNYSRELLAGIDAVLREARVARDSLRPHDRLAGPVTIVEDQTTIVVPVGFHAQMDEHGNVVMSRT